MGVTIKVNGACLSLVHKGSTGIARNTPPDVCKTPSPAGPVPIPYPVIVSMSSDLKSGTKKVKVDGKKMAAVKGSEFSRCTGDEPGTVGGVVSSTNMKEAKWILYSFDVKMEGKNACRMSDKMTMNHGNTVCLQGEMQAPAVGVDAGEVEEACKEAGEKAKEADTKAPGKVKSKTKKWVSAGGCFVSTSGKKLSMGSSLHVTRGDKFAKMGFAQGVKKGEKSKVPCPSKKSGMHEYPPAGRAKEGHAEAKIIEDIFKMEPPPQGKLYIKVVGKAICCACQAIMACAKESGVELIPCPGVDKDPCP